MSNIPPNINDNNNTENEKYKKKVELIFEILKRRYDNAIERRHFLDDKASNLIGYVTIITGIIIIIGLGTFVILEKITNEVIYVLYFSGIGSIILSLIFSLFVIRTKKFKADSNIENLKGYFQDNRWIYEQIIIRHIDIMFDSIPILDNENTKKTNLIQLSWTFLVGGIILLIVFYSLLFNLIPSL
ncbi:MAG: hypothetical protein ACM3VV_00070 [Deltaproteobacteria bacterium]